MVYNTDISDIIKVKRPDMDIDELHLGYSICEIEQKIKNYCHIPKVPKALYYTWANMVLDLLDYENAYNSFMQAQQIYPEYKYNYLNLANIMKTLMNSINMGIVYSQVRS